jgi:hypothetical protein
LNNYTTAANVFDPETIARVERHAESISKILRLALRVHPPKIYPERLRSALKSRAIVDAAVSLIMVHNRCSREQAMELLHLAARASETKLHAIATDILQGTPLPAPRPKL